MYVFFYLFVSQLRSFKSHGDPSQPTYNHVRCMVFPYATSLGSLPLARFEMPWRAFRGLYSRSIFYKPSCCTIGMPQSNLVRQMDGDVNNEEPILAPAAACLYRRRSFAQTLRWYFVPNLLMSVDMKCSKGMDSSGEAWVVLSYQLLDITSHLLLLFGLSCLQ